MPRADLALIVAASAALGAWGQVSSPVDQVPVFRGGTQTVPLYATVLDASGRLVPGLTKRDFRIFDNGEPVEITTFSNDVMPISLVLLLDMSASMSGEHLRVQQAALGFVDALLPDERVRVGTFGDEVALSPWLTSDKDVLRRALREEVWPGGGTPLWAAMGAAMRSLDGVTGRRALLVLSDGIDTGCPTLIGSFAPAPLPLLPLAIPTAQRNAGLFSSPATDPRCSSLAEVERTAAAGEFMTYAIGMEGPGIMGGLEKLPEQTGGGHFELKRNADLATTFGQVADELHHQYALGFEPARLDGETHRLELRLTNTALVARARKSYVATTGTMEASTNVAGEPPRGGGPSAQPSPATPPGTAVDRSRVPLPAPRPQNSLAAILLLDTSASVSRSAMLLDQRFAEIFNAFLGGLEPGDRAAVGIIANQTKFTPLTSDTRELIARVRTLLRVPDADRLGPSPIWDATDDALTLLEGDPGPRAVVLFSDAKASGDRRSSTEVLTHATRAGVVIHSVVEGGGTRLFLQPTATFDPADIVRRVAEGAGGQVWFDRPPNPRDRAPAKWVTQIMAALRAR